MARRKKGIVAKLIVSMIQNQLKKKPSPSGSRPKEPDFTPVYIPDVEPFEIPAGDVEVMAYTYDGRPLKGTRKGSRFQLNIVQDPFDMTSVYTGTTWEGEMNTGLAKDGHAIGYLSSGAKYRLEKLSLYYPNLIVWARRDGTGEEGWPMIKLTVPEIEVLDEMIKSAEEKEV